MDELGREARGRYVRPEALHGGAAEVREAAVGDVYASPDYGALTRRALDDLREVVLDLDTRRREIRRLREETREILAGLAA